MEAEELPSVLSDLLVDPIPVDEKLAHIYRGIADATIELEYGRLQERFLDMASKLITITQIMEER